MLFSSVALAFFFNALIPGLGFYFALALGAILSPTDAVATSIVKRLGVSRRVVTMLEGESLLNDATSLVILRVAVAIAITGNAPEGGILGTFIWGILVAIVIGALVGWMNLRLRALVHNPAANTALGFVVPFIAYLPTERLGGSGLVAAVVAGIVTGQGAARWFTPEQRMSDALNWRTIELLLEGAVFLLMGLELKELLRQNVEDDQGLGHSVWLAAASFAIIMVVRAAYVSLLVWLESRRARHRDRTRLESFSERIESIAAEPRHPDAPRRGARGAGAPSAAAGAARAVAVDHALTGHAGPRRHRLLPGVAAGLEARDHHRLGQGCAASSRSRPRRPSPRMHRSARFSCSSRSSSRSAASWCRG